MPKNPADEADKKSRPSITAFIKTEEQKRIKLRLQRELIDGKADGRYPLDMTMSELILQLLDKQLPAKKRK